MPKRKYQEGDIVLILSKKFPRIHRIDGYSGEIISCPFCGRGTYEIRNHRTNQIVDLFADEIKPLGADTRPIHPD